MTPPVETLRTILFVPLAVLFIVSLLAAIVGIYNPKVVWRWSSPPGRLKIFGVFALALPALLLLVSYGLFVHLLPPATPVAPTTKAAQGISPGDALAFFRAQGLDLRPAEAEDGASLWNGADSVSFADITAQDGSVLSIRLIATGNEEHGFYSASQSRAEAYVVWLAPLQGDAAAWVKACGRGPQPPLPVAGGGSVDCTHKKDSSRVALIYRPAP
jgi:hypothetical protein